MFDLKSVENMDVDTFPSFLFTSTFYELIFQHFRYHGRLKDMHTKLAKKEDGLKKRHEELVACEAGLDVHARKLVPKVGLKREPAAPQRADPGTPANSAQLSSGAPCPLVPICAARYSLGMHTRFETNLPLPSGHSFHAVRIEPAEEELPYGSATV